MFSIDFTLSNFEYFLLIFVRISTFVVVAPFFNNTGVPNMVKIGFSAIVAIMMYYLVPFEALGYSDVIGYAFIVIREAITGLLLGFCTNICNYIILFAGQIIDMDIGLSMAQVMDPQTNNTVAITGSLYNCFLMLLFITSDMHRYVIRAICDSFEVIPPGQTHFEYDHLLAAMITYMGNLFIIAFRIVLPVFATIMVLNCILGVMAKVSPQMNMFAVGMQLKILVGYAVLFFTIFLLPDIAGFIFKEMKEMLINTLEGMY